MALTHVTFVYINPSLCIVMPSLISECSKGSHPFHLDIVPQSYHFWKLSPPEKFLHINKTKKTSHSSDQKQKEKETKEKEKKGNGWTKKNQNQYHHITSFTY